MIALGSLKFSKLGTGWLENRKEFVNKKPHLFKIVENLTATMSCSVDALAVHFFILENF